MSEIDKIKIYSEVSEISKKVFDFYKNFMDCYGNDLSNKLDRNINILQKVDDNFTYSGVLNVRTLLNTGSSDGTWICFRGSRSSEYRSVCIRAEIYTGIVNILNLNENEDRSICMMKLLDFVNKLINDKMKVYR